MYNTLRSIVPAPLRHSLKFLKSELLHHSGYLVRRQEQNPGATHIPVLVGLNTILKAERILELGCGMFSTSLFINRSAFPQLIQLDSFEDDPAWFETVRGIIGSDHRVNLTAVRTTYEAVLNELNLADYDLIFVDNYSNNQQRVETVRTITRLHSIRNTVVFHDFEQRLYRTASTGFQQRYRFTALNPNTGIAWDHSFFEKDQLEAIQLSINAHLPMLLPEEVEGWVNVFGNAG